MGGLLGAGVGYWASLRSARTEQERSLVKQMTVILLVIISVFLGAILTMTVWGRAWFDGHPTRLALSIVATILTYVVTLTGTIFWGVRRMKRLQKSETPSPEEVQELQGAEKPQPIHYQSKAKLFGWPLVCVRLKGPAGPGGPTIPAKGWIAIGDRAYGIVLAIGGIAVGGISVGGLSCGLISVAGVSLGVVSMGGLAIGGWALGGLAIGIMAYGGAAIAWHAALGGLAVAHGFAEGGLAVAREANTEAARTLMGENAIFRYSGLLSSPWFQWVLIPVCFVPMIISLRWRMR